VFIPHGHIEQGRLDVLCFMKVHGVLERSRTLQSSHLLVGRNVVVCVACALWLWWRALGSFAYQLIYPGERPSGLDLASSCGVLLDFSYETRAVSTDVVGIEMCMMLRFCRGAAKGMESR